MRRAAAALVSLVILVGVSTVMRLSGITAPDGRTGEATARGQEPPKGSPPAGPVAPDPCAVAGVDKLVQGFPAKTFDPAQPEKSDSAWEVCWTVELTGSSKVLKIVSARFMWKDKTGKAVWLPVVRHLELAEIYVPYDDGVKAFLDVSNHSFYLSKMRAEFAGPSCVVAPQILGSSHPANDQRVMREIHDDGIRWMSAEPGTNETTNDDRARRGEMMVLWSTFYAANYRYLIEYGFSDDGTIRCRLGFTARNYNHLKADQSDAHLHVGCWRFEPDFGDPTKVSVYTMRRYPTGLGGTSRRFAVEARPFNAGALCESREGSHRWDADEYASLLIQSDVRVNSHGRKAGYNLIPVRTGAVRHLLPQYDSTGFNTNAFNYDFWVTHTEAGNAFFREVPVYAAGQRPLANKPLTVWHSAAGVHIPRGEDVGDDGASKETGVAITAWAEFVLRPRDLFDSSPLYTP
jgi:primary-amine oxidase